MKVPVPWTWYATRKARDEEWDFLVRLYRPWLRGGPYHLGFYLNHDEHVRTIDVTGRSAAYIDRLARDWIGHGVTPTVDGRRGVATTPWRVELAHAAVMYVSWRIWRAEKRGWRAVTYPPRAAD